jgi:HPt (histidine-containing phosphotransfer) domain-containing protein
LYRSLLEQFASKQADADVKIGEALRNGDRETAERLAHTVKGIAGNIGIGRVQDVAATLEKAIRESDGAAEGLISDFRAAMGPVMAGIRSALGEAGPAPAPEAVFDGGRAAAALARLASLIEASDGDAADAVEEVAAAVAGRVDARILGALREAVASFDFDAALTKLKLIAGECHLSGGQDDNRGRQEAHTAR